MSIIIHDALRAYIDPLTEHEFAALERSLLTEGCRDALVCWGDVLIDGHNRYAICQRHQIPFNVIQNNQFNNIEDVQLWMIDNHLARRSVSDFQRGMLALRKKEIMLARATEQETAPADVETTDVAVPIIKTTQSRQEIARAAGISSNAVVQIEKIQRAAAPELVGAVRDGTISISAAAAIASLPDAEQRTAVAGGRKELQQVARQVREKIREQRAPKTSSQPKEEKENAVPATASDAVHSQQDLLQQIATLKSENIRLNEELVQLKAALAAAGE
ncbi:hypothetical protein ACO0LB_08985 [Undibacterium sp. SXout7W]|uniref:hypothetical protein n=1 Tax=Undibacterium sp. SXout7W TaxID=3413049 RepID=UPI003BF3E25C